MVVFTKVMTTSVTVKNPQNYCQDPEAYLLSRLRETFIERSNKCWMASYVIAIRGIVQRSLCTVNSQDASAYANVDVKFEALVREETRGGIHVGVQIIENRVDNLQGSLERKTGDADSIEMRFMFDAKAAGAKEFRKGQFLPTRAVADPFCIPLGNIVCTNSALLLCDRAPPVYKITAPLAKHQKAALAFLASSIAQQLGVRRARSAEKLRFFDDLLYPFKPPAAKDDRPTVVGPVCSKGAPDWEGPPRFQDPTASVHNVLELLEDGSPAPGEVWSQPLTLHRSSPLIARLPASASEEARCLEASSFTCLQEVLTNINNVITAINEMAAFYTDEMIDSHANIWRVMENAQAEFRPPIE